MTPASEPAGTQPRALQVAALVVGNLALALGPYTVRLADTGPVAAGFWRLALALPLLALIARANRQPLGGFSRGVWLAVAGAGLFFALDLAAWHIGIRETKLGNASLFGNSGSIIVRPGGSSACVAGRAPPRRWPSSRRSAVRRS